MSIIGTTASGAMNLLNRQVNAAWDGADWTNPSTLGLYSGGTPGLMSTSGNQVAKFLNAVNNPAQGSGDPFDPMANRQAGLDLTSGRAQNILDDPRINAANQAFQDVVSGKNLPMGEDTVARMQGQQADMRAHAQQAQDQMMQRQLAASGGSIYDGSYQAAQRRSQGQRQLGNAGDARQLAITAALQNFQAQQQAAGNLGNLRGQQYGLGNALASQAADYHMNTYNEPNAGSVQGVGSMMGQQQPQRQQQPQQQRLPPRQSGPTIPSWATTTGARAKYGDTSAQAKLIGRGLTGTNPSNYRILGTTSGGNDPLATKQSVSTGSRAQHVSPSLIRSMY